MRAELRADGIDDLTVEPLIASLVDAPVVLPADLETPEGGASPAEDLTLPELPGEIGLHFGAISLGRPTTQLLLSAKDSRHR